MIKKLKLHLLFLIVIVLSLSGCMKESGSGDANSEIKQLIEKQIETYKANKYDSDDPKEFDLDKTYDAKELIEAFLLDSASLHEKYGPFKIAGESNPNVKRYYSLHIKGVVQEHKHDRIIIDIGDATIDEYTRIFKYPDKEFNKEIFELYNQIKPGEEFEAFVVYRTSDDDGKSPELQFYID